MKSSHYQISNVAVWLLNFLIYLPCPAVFEHVNGVLRSVWRTLAFGLCFLVLFVYQLIEVFWGFNDINSCSSHFFTLFLFKNILFLCQSISSFMEKFKIHVSFKSVFGFGSFSALNLFRQFSQFFRG